MPRHARIVIPGLPHHITQRGNNRQDVFFVDGVRAAYLGLLREQCGKHGVRVLAYCLMTNHVHLVAIPACEESLNLGIGRTHFLYTQYINRLHGRSGHLWEGRFHSCPMDEAYTVSTVRYVERNPVRARITRVPWTYRWSSAAAHTGGVDGAGVLDIDAWNNLVGQMPWKEALADRDDLDTVAELRLNTHTGRPPASDSLLSKLERTLGRRLRPLPVGRPKKEKTMRERTINRWLSPIY
jgi:putative transposase